MYFYKSDSLCRCFKAADHHDLDDAREQLWDVENYLRNFQTLVEANAKKREKVKTSLLAGMFMRSRPRFVLLFFSSLWTSLIFSITGASFRMNETLSVPFFCFYLFVCHIFVLYFSLLYVFFPFRYYKAFDKSCLRCCM